MHTLNLINWVLANGENESRFFCCFFDMFNTKPTQRLELTEFLRMCASTKSKSDVFFLAVARECCR